MASYLASEAVGYHKKRVKADYRVINLMKYDLPILSSRVPSSYLLLKKKPIIEFLIKAQPWADQNRMQVHIRN